MIKFETSAPFRFVVGTVFSVLAPFALASGQPDMSWSITIGSPMTAPRIYGAPTVVYVEPQPVSVRPQPVYVHPVNVVHYMQPYYVEEVRYKKPKHRHWKHRHDD